MSLTFDQAIIELAKLTANGGIATPDELKALANQVSSQSSGSTTVLYSGPLADGTDSGDIVRAMAANGEDVRTIGKTEAAKFLNDERFKQAIADYYKTTITVLEKDRTHPANQFLEGVDGLWGDLDLLPEISTEIM